MMENYPDIILESYQINELYSITLLLLVIISTNLVFGTVSGKFGEIFFYFYQENLNRITTEYPQFNKMLEP